MTKCECGCGGEAKPGNRFINRHSRRGKHHTEESKQKISETLTGRTKEDYEYIRKHSEKMTGRTKENHAGVRRQSEKITGHEGWSKGLTKENNDSLKRTSEKMSGRTKENDEGIRRAEKRKGHTKENDESVRRMAEKRTGRTKENDESVKRGAETQKANWKNKEFREAHSGKNAYTFGRVGEQSNNWQGGISWEPYCEKFDDDLKERVREYFGRCCYICGKSEQEQIDEMIKEGKRPFKKLDVHHVNYDKMVCCNDVKPLFVPLCRKCHSKTHQNKEEWEEFFTASLKYLTNSKCFYTKEETEKKI